MFIMRDAILDQPLKPYKDYSDLQNIFSSKDLAMLNSLEILVSIYVDSEDEVTVALKKHLGKFSESAHHFNFAPSEIVFEYTFEAKKHGLNKFTLGDIIDSDVYFYTKDQEYSKIINNQIIGKDGLRSVGINGYIAILETFLEDFKRDAIDFFVGLTLIDAKFAELDIPDKALYKVFEVPGLKISLIDSDGVNIILGDDNLFSLEASCLKEDIKCISEGIGETIRSESRKFIVDTNYKKDVPADIRYKKVKIKAEAVKKELMLIEMI